MSVNVVVTYPMSDNAVRNFTFEQFFDIFKTTQLDISQFWVINSGFDNNGVKKYAHLVIRGCAIRPLFGPHLVSVFEIPSVIPDGQEIKPKMRTFWVHSLTDLRRNLFCFCDRLSFERSTYLIPFPNGELLIRLKSIRAFLKLPILMENTVTAVPVPQYVAEIASSEEEGEEDEEEENQVQERICLHEVLMQEKSCKMKSLLNHHVQVMVSYLNRELHQDSPSSILVVQSYVTSYCRDLLNQMNKNH
jgi:hypothetical protein